METSRRDDNQLLFVSPQCKIVNTIASIVERRGRLSTTPLPRVPQVRPRLFGPRVSAHRTAVRTSGVSPTPRVTLCRGRTNDNHLTLKASGRFLQGGLLQRNLREGKVLCRRFTERTGHFQLLGRLPRLCFPKNYCEERQSSSCPRHLFSPKQGPSGDSNVPRRGISMVPVETPVPRLRSTCLRPGPYGEWTCPPVLGVLGTCPHPVLTPFGVRRRSWAVGRGSWVVGRDTSHSGPPVVPAGVPSPPLVHRGTSPDPSPSFPVPVAGNPLSLRGGTNQKFETLGSPRRRPPLPPRSSPYSPFILCIPLE